MDVSVTIMIGTLIGAVTFSGSLIAFGKLQEIIATRPVTFPLQKTFSLLLFVGILAMIGYLVIEPDMTVFIGLSVACLLLGILLVIPIGGADMPVVISLLNSYSGLAAASAGFVLGNVMLIIAGALVGAAGLILTQIMTKAMNRSLVNVVFGAFGAVETVSGSVDPGRETRPVREVAHEDSAVMLAYARSVIFVPGYGLAVAQAQHQLKELGALIEANGVAVKYAIHPVAGRMPGHMNVLLAEADVPYDKLYDLEQINDEFSSTDVVVVVGANDVVNPGARDDAESPIYGMPILNVDRSGQVIVLKRSLSPGFAGIDNDLFYKENTSMLFGDARESLVRVIAAIEDL
jgi:NAD(P) transhydrogenase subunit beta